ncbi:DUF397 domain-containing protein [Streptomyces sp. ISL-99]|uniref:DUF397 domain-containing protein n=1 Tax=Streptomyces sp. ISL-99 TaxID=2819193 RepID=UPI001BE947DB|nr:DUF397 domain-containing protein [Streptomyces sp. ISL-99]MBT2527716.1 DUF397 domain-containing protein [Streptomyces sp. ISL-99]
MSNTPDLSRAEWLKSSYSNTDGGNCVEFARTFLAAGVVPIRDSKAPQGPALVFPAAAFSSFVSAVRGGELPPR